jgi:diguanylate cyclase (GGDEF)-like protein
MSLFRRIWLTIIGLTLAAFIGSLLVNVLNARSYLEKQLTLKNMDNATALALSMSQIAEKDPVTIELLVAAQFDTGHYQEIRLADPSGQVMVERRQEKDAEPGAPAWFVALLPIEAQPGVAHIQDGWKQFGTITLASQSRFAYQDLWRGTLELSGWFLVGGILAGILASLMLRLVTRPLDAVVEQAQAIAERRFVTVAVPEVPELKSVVQAMNAMVQRVRQMFADEATRLDALRRQVNLDSITGLPNREFFISRLREALGSEEAAPTGVLAFVRLSDLNEINRQLGHAGTDELLRRVAAVLTETHPGHSDWQPARVRGPDFALLAAGAGSAVAQAEALARALQDKVAPAYPAIANLFHVAAVSYRRGDGLDVLLPAADSALAAAENKGPNSWHAVDQEGVRPLAASGEAWRNLLSDALSEQRLRLARYPVVNAAGDTLHSESVVRLQAERDGPWLSAGDFMPMAVRLNLAAPLDLQVVRLALDGLEASPGDVAVNLSADTIADWGFRNSLVELLGKHPALCRRLWIEVPESGAFRQLDAFRDLCRTLKGLGCRIGVEHFGQRFGEIAKLSDLGLDYLKVDGSFVAGIDANAGNQEFLRGLCNMAHAIGVSVIAEGVRSQAELAALPGLGFDGVTGPAVAEKA